MSKRKYLVCACLKTVQKATAMVAEMSRKFGLMPLENGDVAERW